MAKPPLPLVNVSSEMVEITPTETAKIRNTGVPADGLRATVNLSAPVPSIERSREIVS